MRFEVDLEPQVIVGVDQLCSKSSAVRRHYSPLHRNNPEKKRKEKNTPHVPCVNVSSNGSGLFAQSMMP